MIPPNGCRLILLGTTETVTGDERLMAAFEDGDDMVVPVELDRSSNKPLLAAAILYVHDGDGVTVWQSACRPATNAERAVLDKTTEGPLGEHLGVLRLTAPSAATSAAPAPVGSR